jgi:hypothetical protein
MGNLQAAVEQYSKAVDLGRQGNNNPERNTSYLLKLGIALFEIR